jgi:hypothetical protein
MVSVQVFLAFALLTVSLSTDASATTHLPFKPREYPKKIASCPAINRAENTEVDIELRKSTLSSGTWKRQS